MKPKGPMEPDRHDFGDDLPLFQQHSPTSRDAWESVEASGLRGIVLNYLTAKGEDGATDEEMQAAMSMNPSTQRPRRVELVASGLVKDSGRVRDTSSGRRAVVWIATHGEPVPVVKEKPREAPCWVLLQRGLAVDCVVSAQPPYQDGEEWVRGMVTWGPAE